MITELINKMIEYEAGCPQRINHFLKVWAFAKQIAENENIDSKTNKNLGWALSYGLGYAYTDYFYVNDYDSFYDLEKIKDTVVQVISFDTYLDKFVVSFTLKTSKFALTNENSTRENWGGVNIAYLF